MPDATPDARPDPAPDRVVITDLECEAVIGVSDRERGGPQKLEIDLVLEFPPRRRTRLAETADYREIARVTREVAGGEDRLLLEHLAEDIALALKRSTGAGAVTVRIRKPRIAPKYGAGTIGVEVTR
ncbi:MAG: dihydroneopterin aldolase [Longimicrobiales bacterium]|nr:dihydroneopterin aldolase [Longimicrobiales bacterium]